MSTTRRTKWHPAPPPPPSPKILHLPRSRRTRRKKPKSAAAAHHDHNNNDSLSLHQRYLSFRGKLENLFDQEETNIDQNSNPIVLLDPDEYYKSTSSQRRERVEEQEEGEEGVENMYEGRGLDHEEEKWRFQAEILRAECNFLRMEREFALKKLEKNRMKMERTLRSAVQTLVSGRNKIFEGKNASAVLEEEIEDLAEKLEELQKSSRIKDCEVRKCSNFDKKACLLQRRLEKLGGLSDDFSVKELQELAELSLSINTSHDLDTESSVHDNRIKNGTSDNLHVEMLKKKMEGLSKVILDRVEDEYRAVLPSTANSSVASSASTSKRIDQSSFSTRHLSQESLSHMLQQESASHEENKCSGRCKAIIRRIVQQVRTETEQWSQMQQMLGKVRGEMEELQGSRDFWQQQAQNADNEVQSLRQTVDEWKEKALGSESKVNELETELSAMKKEIQNSKTDLNSEHKKEKMLAPPGKQLEKGKSILSNKLNERYSDSKGRQRENAKENISMEENEKLMQTKDPAPVSLGKQLAQEKRLLLRRLKEKHHVNISGRKEELPGTGRRKTNLSSTGFLAPKRSPLRDIGNSSPLTGQCSNAVFIFHSPESCKIREILRK